MINLRSKMASVILHSLNLAILISLAQSKNNEECALHHKDQLCANNGLIWINKHRIIGSPPDKKGKMGHGKPNEGQTKKEKCKRCTRYGRDTICASDGRSWINKHCMLACSPAYNVRFVHEGLCRKGDKIYPDKGRDKVHKPGKAVDTPHKDKYTGVACKDCPDYGSDVVCANDGLSWLNIYCMYGCSTLENVKFVHMGTCAEFYELYPHDGEKSSFKGQTKKEKCKRCTRYGRDTICASDGRSWINKHCMLACSPAYNVRFVHEGLCRKGDKIYPDKGRDKVHKPGKAVDPPHKDKYTGVACKDCPDYGSDVVCANDGLSWLNIYCMYGCSTLENVKFVHMGTCAEFYELYPDKG